MENIRTGSEAIQVAVILVLAQDGVLICRQKDRSTMPLAASDRRQMAKNHRGHRDTLVPITHVTLPTTADTGTRMHACLE